MRGFAKGCPTWPDWFSPPSAGLAFVPQGFPPQTASDGFSGGAVSESLLQASRTAAKPEASTRGMKDTARELVISVLRSFGSLSSPNLGVPQRTVIDLRDGKGTD